MYRAGIISFYVYNNPSARTSGSRSTSILALVWTHIVKLSPLTRSLGVVEMFFLSLNTYRTKTITFYSGCEVLHLANNFSVRMAWVSHGEWPSP